MSGDLIPSSTPKKSGDNQAATDKSGGKGNPIPEQKTKPPKSQPRKWFGFTQKKWTEIAGFAVLVPWIYNDLTDTHNFGKLISLAVSLAIAQGVVLSFLKSRSMALVLWSISIIPLAGVVWENSRPEPRPHFTVSFATDDTQSILLTNEWLFQEKFKSVGTNVSKNTIFLNSFPHACIIIPVDQLKTNVIFDFEIKNDSSITSHDLSMAVGFPSDWKIGIDAARWKVAREHLVIPGWELSYSNLQSWVADNPSPMFPGDSIQFSITNFTVPIYINSASKNGVISFIIRSTGFEEMISANLMFFPKSEDFIKPVITKKYEGTNGLWHISITPKELEDSQK